MGYMTQDDEGLTDKKIQLLDKQNELEDDDDDSSDISNVTLYIEEWGDGVRNWCRKQIYGNIWFERFWLTVIVLNCITLSMEDPTDKDCVTSLCKFTKYSDYVFVFLFVVEFLIKVLGLSFIARPDAYIKDEWNMLDFIIVVSGLLSFFLEVIVKFNGPGITGLRAFRLLRPLKAVQAFPGVRVLVLSILASLPQLLDVFILYFFFLLIMGIIAIQQWKGLFRWHCVTNDSLAAVESSIPNATLVLAGDRICTTGHHPNIGGHICEWGSTCREFGDNPNFGKLSFDNMGVTALTLFIALTLEGWTDSMYETMYATTYFASFFWIILIIFGSFFILNLTIVIITESFAMKQEEQTAAVFHAIDKDGGGELDKDEVRKMLKKITGKDIEVEELDKVFSEMDKDGGGTVTIEEFMEYASTHQNLIASTMSKKGPSGTGLGMGELVDNVKNVGPMGSILSTIMDHLNAMRERGPLRDFLYQYVEPTGENTTKPFWNKMFRGGVMFVILLNTITLAAEHHNQPTIMTDILFWLNILFTIVFGFEAAVKLFALGPLDYFGDGFNCFDFLIAVLSVVELMNVVDAANVSVFRTFRALRVLRLAKQVPILQRWIGILLSSMKGAAILTALLLLVVFIVSLLGMQLFGGEFCHLDDSWNPDAPGLSEAELSTGRGCGGVPRSNYDNLGASLLTSFQILTGEDWNKVMYNGMRSVGDWVSLYFVLYYILGNYMMLNLFIAVLLSSRDLKETGSTATEDDEDREDDFKEEPSPYGEEVGSPMAEWKKLGAYEDIEEDPSSPTAKADDVLRNYETAEPGGTIIAKDTLETKQGKIKWPPWIQKRIDSERSLLFFDHDSPIRNTMLKIVESNYFEALVLIAILVSTVTLALEDPMKPVDHPREQTLATINFIMVWVFVAESVFKSVAMGFIMHPTSYLRKEGWNVLDFIIVLVSLISLVTPGAENLDFIKVMRALRPLRFINKFEGMKVVVQALLRSIAPLMNVLLISLLVWLIFGILGVQIFSGKFYRCSLDSYGDMEDSTGITLKVDCLNITKCNGPAGEPCRWITYDSNFDNLPNAFLNLFEVASLEGWVDVMNLGIDAVSVDEAPRKNNNPIMALYFVIFIVFGAFFIINMFIGVLIDTYYQEKEKASSGGIFLNERQKMWVNHHSKMLNIMSSSAAVQRQENHTYLSAFVSSFYFDMAITCCICINVILMALEFYPAPDYWNTALDWFNTGFYVIFALEAAIKILDDYKGYFNDVWNRFDFTIVCLSTVGIIVSLFVSAGAAVSMFRVLRLARLLRMVKKAQGIKRILRTLYLSLPSMINVAGILSLMFFVYAVLGVKLFAKLKRNDSMGPYANFENFCFSLLLLLRMTTGEAWQAILKAASVQPPHDCDSHLDECGSPTIAAIYFCSFTLSGMYVLLNLFIAVILDAFSQSDSEDTCSEEYMEKVRIAWNNRQRTIDGYEGGGLHPDDLESFLVAIGPPLGPEENCSKREMTKFTILLDLKLDQGSGLIPQGEIIPKLFRLKYGQDLPETIQQQLKEKEKEHGNAIAEAPEETAHSLSYQLSLIRAQALVRGWLTRHLLKKRIEKEKLKRSREPYPWVADSTWPSGEVHSFALKLYPPEGGPRVPLGFGLDPDSCRVTRVNYGSSAHLSGMSPGYLIKSVNGLKPKDPGECGKLMQFFTSRGEAVLLEVETADPNDILLERYAGDDKQLNFIELVNMCRDMGVPHPLSHVSYEEMCNKKELDPSAGFAWRDVHEIMSGLSPTAQQRVLEKLNLSPPKPDVQMAYNPLATRMSHHTQQRNLSFSSASFSPAASTTIHVSGMGHVADQQYPSRFLL